MTTQQLIDLCVALDASRYYSASKRLVRFPDGDVQIYFALSSAESQTDKHVYYEGKCFEACYAQFEQAMLNPAPENNE